MIQPLLLYFNTLRFLKFKQVYYQIYYRIKWRFFYNINYYKARDHFKLQLKSIAYPYLYAGNQSIRHLSFDLLNQTKEFESFVDWNFNGYGKLWNYHLQYMEFLLDEAIPLTQRNDLFRDASRQILSGCLKLEPYPVSRRIFSSLLFINTFNQVPDNFCELALKRQLHFLEKNLEYHLDANHLLENFMALCFGYCYFNDLNIFSYYLSKLEAQLNTQILDDGAHFEKCPSYHLNILYRLLLIFQTADVYFRSNVYLDSLKHSISKMFSWADQMLLIQANFPLFNDSVYGQNPDYGQLQSIGKLLSISINEIPLGASGYKKLRQGDFYLILNCGNIMPSYQPGHLHADMLHMVLYYKNNAILVDTGISTYENNPSRLHEKATASHNTVCFENENQSQIWSVFRMAKRAKVQLISFSNNSLEACVTWHNGFQHKRSILLTGNCLRIEDCIVPLRGKLKSTIANFHFDASIQLEPSENEWHIHKPGLKIKFENSHQIELANYEQAVDFNSKLDSTKLTVHFEKTLITYFKLIS